MSQTCKYCYNIVARACQSGTEAESCPNLRDKPIAVAVVALGIIAVCVIVAVLRHANALPGVLR